MMGQSKNNYDFDLVIIGSGVGGGTFADYFTRNNEDLKLAIIESGPFRDKNFFNQREKDMPDLYFSNGSALSKNMQIGVSAANTVGGSSAVYTGVSFRTPENVIRKWRDQHGMSFLNNDFIESSFEEIERDLNIHELPSSWDNQNNLLFKKGAVANEIEVKRLKINIKGCQQQGFCNIGCTSGAKQGTLELQIPRVLKRGVKLFANTKVERLAENTVFCEVKDAPKGTPKNTFPSGKLTLTAKYIVVAAGVLNTPALLMRSADKLAISTKNLGRYITLHPAFNLNAVYPEQIKNYRGFPKTMYSDQFSKTDGFYLETSFYYPGITAKNIPGYGEEHQSIMKDYHKLMSILILLHDKAEKHNRISIDKSDKLIINYVLAPDAKEKLAKAIRVAAKIFFKAGCVRASLPGSSKAILVEDDLSKIDKIIDSKYLNFYKTPLSSAHPQGGARMGIDPSVSVCDTMGKVYGTESIYVSDASLFPGSSEVNPYLTIMLLAKHIAEGLKSKINKEFH